MIFANSKRCKRYGFLFGLICAVLLAALYFQATLTDGDEGRYLLLARSIAQGQGQSNVHYPEPSPEWLTPSLYPWVLGGLYAVFPSIIFLKAFSWVCYAVAVFLFVLYLRRESLNGMSMASIMALGMLTVFSLYYSWMILSEAFFLVFVMLFILLMPRIESGQGLRFVFAAALIAGGSVLVRPVGIALVGAGVLSLFFRGRWRDGLIFLAAALAVNMPTIMRTMSVLGVPFAYMAHFDSAQESRGVLTAFLQMMHAVSRLLPTHFLDGMPRAFFFSLFDNHCLLCNVGLGWMRPFAMTVISLLVLIGWGRMMYVRRSAAEWLFLIFWPLISTYHVHLTRGIEFRYFFPVLPLAALYLYRGLETTAWGLRRIFKRDYPGERSVSVCAALMAVYVLTTSMVVAGIRIQYAWETRGMTAWAPERMLMQDDPDRRAFGRYLETVLWAKTNTPPDAVIVSRKPAHTYLFSDRKSHRYDMLNDVTGVWNTITYYVQSRPVYLLEDAFSVESGYGRDRRGMLLPAMRAHSNALHLVYATREPVTRLWRVTAGDGTEMKE